MERKHIITISGKPGSGKSSTAERVAELLGYTRHSSGDIVREMIKKKKMTLMEFNTEALENPDLDNKVDAELRNLRNQRDIVIDSRLGFYWIPESFKVFLWLSNEVAMARIYKDANLNTKRSSVGEESDDMSDIFDQVEERQQNERDRFRKRYGVNPFDTSHFDLVVDTSRHSPQTVALTIFDMYKKWLRSDSWKQVVSKVPLGYSYNDQFDELGKR
jgi:cytidylate kinase